MQFSNEFDVAFPGLSGMLERYWSSFELNFSTFFFLKNGTFSCFCDNLS